MMRVLVPFVLLCLLLSHAAGEVTCICRQSECSCFIQFGDEGQAVQRIEETLTWLL